MPQVATDSGVPFKLSVRRVKLTEEQFALLCQENRDFRFELTAQQELVIMPPAGAETGWRNGRFTYRLIAWSDVDGTGLAFDSSAGFTLPNGAIRSPDAAWVKRDRWDALTQEQREKFAPLCPDFVVELRSRTDRLADLQEKMQEYMDNGARLGWLLDPLDKRVHVYRPDQPVEVIDNPDTLSGDPVLPGFVLLVRELWYV
ncbi:MAG: Uma2 family endonuclease [Deltaproteobacteria bacterium]|nr:Uma2 family endonuclease [Deltaproteobacteria bacterium]